MGVCASRCGETQHQGGPAAISHRNYSFDDNTESLKKFLHLHGTVRSAVSTPRTSLGDLSAVIPHSSELFSLPASDPDRSSFAISPSPARTSRASPRSRNSCSCGGRFSVDKTATGCRKRIRPAPDAAAHQRLVEAIARLERLNDGKELAVRGSDLDRTDAACKAPQLTASRSRHVRHYQLPLQLPKSDMATPVIPLANSVTNFLREVESFVWLMEAPRASGAKPTKNVHFVTKSVPRRGSSETDSDEMFTFFEATSDEDGEARRKRSPAATSLHRLVMSAAQGCHRVENLSPVAEKALVAPVAPLAKSDPPSKSNQSAEQSRPVVETIDIVDPCIESVREERGVEDSRAALTEIDVNVVALLKKSPSVRRSSPSRMRAWKGFRRRLSRSLDSRESGAVHVDFEYLLRNASRLSNVSNNKTSTAQATSGDAKSTEELVLLPVTSMLSCPDIKQEQAVEEKCTVEILDTSTVELATSEQPLPQVVMLVEDQSPTTSTEPESLEELAANLETPSMEDEDLSPSILASAESSFREADDLECPETNAGCGETLAPECLESVSPSVCGSCPTETDFHPIPDTTHPEDFRTFLSKTFNSLFKLLLVTDGEQTGPECTPTLDEKMGLLEEENVTGSSEQCSWNL